MTPGHTKSHALISFLERLGCPAPDDLYERLRRDHDRPTTPYHCWRHILHGLDLIWEYQARIPDFDAVVLAWLNHDRIYDPRRADNEEASAELARALCMELGLEHLAGQVHDLVLDTKHTSAPMSAAGRWIVGIDLAILGEAAETFADYDADIRREYSHVSDERYRAGRKKFLQGILGRDRIYLVPELYERFELQARENMRRALRDL